MERKIRNIGMNSTKAMTLIRVVGHIGFILCVSRYFKSIR